MRRSQSGMLIKDIEEKDLPEEFQNKSDEEKEVMILEINGDRERFQKEIADLAVKRNDFIEAEKKKRAEEGREVDDFGSSVNEAINDKALKNGFSKEK